MLLRRPKGTMRSALYVMVLLMAFRSFGQQIVIGYSDLEFPPYIVGTDTKASNKNPGVTVELLKMVSSQLGTEVVFKRAPWSRLLKMAENNQVDAIFHASFNVARTEFLEYPMQNGSVDELKYLKRQRYFLYKQKYTLIYSKHGKIYGADGDVGATTNYAIVTKLEQQGITVKETVNAYKGLELLSKGRIIGWVGLESISDKVIDSDATFKDIIKEPIALSNEYSYLAFSKGFYSNHPEISLDFWEKIKATTTSPHYLTLFDKYH